MFKRYEPHITRIVFDFPKPVTINPHPLSTETFKCRLRDAINSLLEYHWPTHIDSRILASIWPQIAVGESDGLVVIAKTEELKELTAAGQVVPTRNEDKFIAEVDSPSDKTLVALAYLLDQKVLTRPVKIKNVPREKLDNICNAFDVAISDDQRGWFIML